MAAAGAAVLGLTPTLSASPDLLANEVYYLGGTKIGDTTSHPAPLVFAGRMMTGAGETPPTAADFHDIDYPASIWPLSTGGLNDPTWNESVAQGVDDLGEQPASGDTVFGFSQGAVVATEYKRTHLGNGVNYVLVENPNRPNGGILERFNGLNVPILDIAFNGATPVVDDPDLDSGTTVDISRQYDGWSDFPVYPLNLLATANAIAGIVYLHGDTQDLDSSSVSTIDTADPMYYQVHGDTTYYLIPTDRLPLLMPFEGIVPDPILTAADAPLRYLVELGYDRSDYSSATTAGIAPLVNPVTVAQGLADATAQGVQDGLGETGASAPGLTSAKASDPSPALTSSLKALAGLKPVAPKALSPKLGGGSTAMATIGKDVDRRRSAGKAVASALNGLTSKSAGMMKPDLNLPASKNTDFKVRSLKKVDRAERPAKGTDKDKDTDQG